MCPGRAMASATYYWDHLASKSIPTYAQSIWTSRILQNATDYPPRKKTGSKRSHFEVEAIQKCGARYDRSRQHRRSDGNHDAWRGRRKIYGRRKRFQEYGRFGRGGHEHNLYRALHGLCTKENHISDWSEPWSAAQR